MIRTWPKRRIILHFMHIFFTEERTFTVGLPLSPPKAWRLAGFVSVSARAAVKILILAGPASAAPQPQQPNLAASPAA